jgi:VWFA-related protein
MRGPRLSLGIVVCALVAGLVVRAQEPGGHETGAPDRPIFRLSVSLVQLDAVVTDRRGRHVTTLGPEDFDVRQDGRPQRVVAATYVRADERWEDTSGLPPLAGSPRAAADAARTIAIVIDDLRMSFESVHRAREGLGRFVDAALLPDDYVALVTTSGAPGSSIAFTYSRPQLRAAVARLRFSLLGTPTESLLDPVSPFDSWSGSGLLEFFRERTLAEGVLRRIEEIATVLPAEGGRKTIVLVSEGFSILGDAWRLDAVNSAMRRLVDRANRAGVVIYAVDPRGLVNTGLSAADAVRGGHGAQAVANRRHAALVETQDGLRYIAAGTGGFAVVNTNDIRRALGRIIDDQAGYYLVGYEPEDGTFGPGSTRTFRRVKVRVTRRGLKIRTRAGFYARPTE